jgi:hypothetical protein
VTSPDAPEDSTPRPHLEHRLVLSHDSHGTVHGYGTAGRFNTWLAVKITKVVGSMWMAYVFAALALISLPAAIASGQVIIIVAWIAQTFLQLVLLPIIIVGQNVQAAAADARSQATYDDAVAVLEEAKQIQQHLAAQDAVLAELVEVVRARPPA